MQVQGVAEAQVKLQFFYSLTLGTQQCDVLKLGVLRQEYGINAKILVTCKMCFYVWNILYAALSIKFKKFNV
jgi:hypothetical protein